MMWLISKVVRQKYNSSGNLQRSNLVWAVFENVVLSNSGRFVYFRQIHFYFQKQPFADNLQDRCFKNFAIFTGKETSVLGSFLQLY